MSDAAEIVHTDIDKKIGDKDYTLKALNSYDLARLIREWRKSEKEKLVENLKLIGADQEQMWSDLRAFDEDPPENWIKYINSEDGMLHVLRLALEKSNPGQGEKLITEINWSKPEMISAVCKLTGLKESAKLPAEPPADPNATYGTEGADPKAETLMETATYKTPSA